MSNIISLETYLEKLDKLNFTKYDDDMLIDEKRDVKVHLNIEFHVKKEINLPSAQAVIRVSHQNKCFSFWGSCSNTENSIIIDWFLKHKHSTRDIMDNNNDENIKKIKTFLSL
jgi:hypothetical protein